MKQQPKFKTVLLDSFAGVDLGWGSLECPICNREIRFEKSGTIEVNCESKQKIEVNGLWELVLGCKNPCCKWSKVQ